MKFSRDTLEYVQFVTNFRDSIESQVTDKSQRLTLLLAQCTGKAKEAVRSSVNLAVSDKYTEAWRNLEKFKCGKRMRRLLALVITTRVG